MAREAPQSVSAIREVVVTGMGAVTPFGVGAGELLARWAAGHSGICGGLAPCSGFDPAQHLGRKEARRSDRFTQLAIVAADEAAAQAGWESAPPLDPTMVACVLGTGIGGLATLEAGLTRLHQDGSSAVPALTVPLMMGNAASGVVSIRHRILGPSYGVVSACAASAHAIGHAFRMIQHGEVDAAMTGGAEAPLTPFARAAFSSMDALSPSGVSRPFDARRDGFVMGEGAGILVLEAAEVAAARGATPIARLRGYGASGDAHHLTAPRADGVGAARAISAALRDAGLAPGDIDYVNAHGTSTPLNDRAETAALKRALGGHAARVPVSSLKSAVGHSLGAAGAVEAVATVLALRERVVPPTLGWEQPEEGLDLDYVPQTARPLKVNGRTPVALSNSFGFGGHNAALVLETV